MMMTREEARDFAAKWLPAWTGNRPEVLADFYSDDCYYMDAGIPEGASGKQALIAYFKKLLGQNPAWVWTQTKATPMEDGFVNFWHARIPVGSQIVDCTGVCLVQFDTQGKIRRNEVFFDRTELIATIRAHLRK